MIGTTRRENKESKTIDWVSFATKQTKPGEEPKEKIIYRIHPEKEANKLIFQIGTADPERAVAASRLVAADVAGIDVNAGCPKPFSTSGGMGAALLRTPDKLCAILDALVKEIAPEFNIGISVKIRILETATETEALVRRLVATGITGLTVHCRTTPMRPRERAIRGQLRMVADICHEAGVACLMNGDVANRDEGLKLSEEFGADGAMIATAAEKNPSCFRSQAEGGVLGWEPVVEEYVKLSMDVHNRFGNTKYLLAQMMNGKDARYIRATQSKSYTELCKAMELEHLIEQAQDADSTVGLDPIPVKPSQKAKNNATAQAAGGHSDRTKDKRKSLSERAPNLHTETTPLAQPEHQPVALTG